MDPSFRLFQLTLFGLRLSEAERQSLLATPLPSWESICERVVTPTALEKIHRRDWCRERWCQLDEQTKKHGLRWTWVGQADFPEGLLRLSDPPLIFSYQGEPAWTKETMISVVGSREPMADSIDWMRRHLLPALHEGKVTAVSGGARGVDAFAHELTLLSGRPPICFLPSGLLRPYPNAHAPLFRRILDAGGALISGFPPDAEMRKSYFHARNRWIAGISLLTLIIEAQRKSGSYLTARMAMEEGRSIATLPVSPLAGRGLGNLDLLFDGAFLLRNKEDLLSLIESER